MSFSFEILSKMFINIEIITTIFCVTAQHNLSVTERLSNWFLFSFCSFTVSERKLRSLAHFEPRGAGVAFGSGSWLALACVLFVGARAVRCYEMKTILLVLCFSMASTATIQIVRHCWLLSPETGGYQTYQSKLPLEEISLIFSPKSMPVIQRHLSS